MRRPPQRTPPPPEPIRTMSESEVQRCAEMLSPGRFRDAFLRAFEANAKEEALHCTGPLELGRLV